MKTARLQEQPIRVAFKVALFEQGSDTKAPPRVFRRLRASDQTQFLAGVLRLSGAPSSSSVEVSYVDEDGDMVVIEPETGDFDFRDDFVRFFEASHHRPIVVHVVGANPPMPPPEPPVSTEESGFPPEENVDLSIIAETQQMMSSRSVAVVSDVSVVGLKAENEEEEEERGDAIIMEEREGRGEEHEEGEEKEVGAGEEQKEEEEEEKEEEENGEGEGNPTAETGGDVVVEEEEEGEEKEDVGVPPKIGAGNDDVLLEKSEDDEGEENFEEQLVHKMLFLASQLLPVPGEGKEQGEEKGEASQLVGGRDEAEIQVREEEEEGDAQPALATDENEDNPDDAVAHPEPQPVEIPVVIEPKPPLPPIPPSSIVVIDFGTCNVRFGLATQNEPAISSSLVGRGKYGGEKGRVICGERLMGLTKYDLHRVVPTYGSNASPTDFVPYVAHIFNKLRVSEIGKSVLLIVPPPPHKGGAKMCKTILQSFESVERVCALPAAPLSLFAAGKKTGLVLDCGAQHTSASPVYEGHILHQCMVENLSGGKSIDDLIRTKGLWGMPSGQQQFAPEYEAEVIRCLKECHGRVKQEFETLDDQDVDEAEFSLPDGIIITCPDGLLEATEILFTGIDLPEVLRESFASVKRLYPSLEREMSQNVVVSGGVSRMPGFAERITSEVSRDFLGFVVPDDSHISAWKGGALISRLDAFRQRWVERVEYDDLGSRAIRAKCFC